MKSPDEPTIAPFRPRKETLVVSLAIAGGLPLALLAATYPMWVAKAGRAVQRSSPAPNVQMMSVKPVPVQRVAHPAIASSEEGTGRDAASKRPARKFRFASPSRFPREWDPETAALADRLGRAESVNSALNIQLVAVRGQLKKAMADHRRAEEALTEAEMTKRERIQEFAAQIATLTQRLADSTSRGHLRERRVADLELRLEASQRLATRRESWIGVLEDEVAALSELERISQERLVSLHGERNGLSAELDAQRTRGQRFEEQLARAGAAAARQREQIAAMEKERAAAGRSFEARLLLAQQQNQRRDQQIAALQRSLGLARAKSSEQARELDTARSTVRGLEQAVKALSGKLIGGR